jgi:hypothetical protein
MMRARVIGFALLLGWTIPFSAQALCCVCTPLSDPNAKACVKTAVYTTCNDLRSNTSNEALKTAQCDLATLTEVECNAQSAPGGRCPAAPVSDTEFAKPSGYVVQQPALVPKLNVEIPGLVFATKLGESGGFLTIPFLSQYIAAAFTYLVGISSIAAAIMIVYGGFLYIIGSSLPQIKRGKEIITDSIIGLLILLSSYLILYTLNPDLLTLAPLRIRPITTEDYKYMTTSEAGFKYAEYAVQNETTALNSPTGGTLPNVAPQIGENVSIANIVANGTAVEKMRAYCTSPAAAGQLKTYDEKIQALVRVILGWKNVCVDEKGCAYYRGGFTSLASGKITGTALDTPYAINNIKTFGGKDPAWDTDCATRWEPIAAQYYKAPVSDGTKEGLAKALAERKEVFKDFFPGGRCNKVVFKQYYDTFGAKYEERGIFGGDCGTTLVQAYGCAVGPGGMTRGSPGYYTMGSLAGGGTRPQGSDVVVWKAMSWEEYVQQANAAGGLRFGDIVTVGSENWLHNLMYTGGRQDVPFDWFEMGSSGMDGKAGTPVNAGLLVPVGGMAAWPTGTSGDYFLHLAKKKGGKIFPIYVWRPFAFEACASKSECKTGEACRCAPSDSNAYLANKCSNANMCHTIKPNGTCSTDEHCANGQTCVKSKPASPSGVCRDAS